MGEGKEKTPSRPLPRVGGEEEEDPLPTAPSCDGGGEREDPLPAPPTSGRGGRGRPPPGLSQLRWGGGKRRPSPGPSHEWEGGKGSVPVLLAQAGREAQDEV